MTYKAPCYLLDLIFLPLFLLVFVLCSYLSSWCFQTGQASNLNLTRIYIFRVRWHHRLDGHEFEWTLGVGDGQGCLACCSSWGRKESDTTEQLNWTELNWTYQGPCTGCSLCLECSSKNMKWFTPFMQICVQTSYFREHLITHHTLSTYFALFFILALSYTHTLFISKKLLSYVA